MFSKKQTDKYGLVILGLTAIIISYYALVPGPHLYIKKIGFLLGLVCGFIGVIADRRIPKILMLILSPIGAIIFLFFSSPMAGGYFIGAAITYFICSAVAFNEQSR